MQRLLGVAGCCEGGIFGGTCCRWGQVNFSVPRKSLKLVRVGPVTKRSPSLENEIAFDQLRRVHGDFEIGYAVAIHIA